MQAGTGGDLSGKCDFVRFCATIPRAIILPVSAMNNTRTLHPPVCNGALDLETFGDFVRQRRSIRRYQPVPVPRAVVEALLETAIWAPSAHNRQPWRFCVVIEQPVKEELSRRMGDAWRQDMSADGADPALIEQRVATSRARLTGAPVLVIPCVSLEDMDVYPDGERNRAEWLMAVQSVALASQNLLLAAHAAGLGACWICAPLCVPSLVVETLDLPAHWQPQAIITLGYPAEQRERERTPVAQRVVWR